MRGVVMLISVIPIGNSRGIRLPKAILDQLHVSDTLELEVEDQQIILRPVTKKPRHNWNEAFIKMHQEQQDTMLLPETKVPEAFEWEW
jgi:antitoxin MazE